MADIYVSCDLAQLQDYSAITVTKVRYLTTRAAVVDDDFGGRFDARDRIPVFEVTHIDRVQGIPYADVLKRCQLVLEHPNVLRDPDTLAPQDVMFLMDASGLGQAVLEIAWRMDLEPVPIVITSGQGSHFADGRYHVPRTELISSLIVAAQSRRVKVARVPLSEVLSNELMNLRLKVSRTTARETYEGYDANEHDDIVMSLAMSIWKAMQEHEEERIYANKIQNEKARDTVNWGTFDGLRGGA